MGTTEDHQPDHSPAEQVLIVLQKRYPFRMRRFMKDLAWVQTQAAKRGVTIGGFDG